MVGKRVQVWILECARYLHVDVPVFEYLLEHSESHTLDIAQVEASKPYFTLKTTTIHPHYHPLLISAQMHHHPVVITVGVDSFTSSVFAAKTDVTDELHAQASGSDAVEAMLQKGDIAAPEIISRIEVVGRVVVSDGGGCSE